MKAKGKVRLQRGVCTFYVRDAYLVVEKMHGGAQGSRYPESINLLYNTDLRDKIRAL